MDSQVEHKAQFLLNSDPCILTSKIEAIQFSYDEKNIGLPCEGQIVIDISASSIAINVKNNKTNSMEIITSCMISTEYPFVELNKRSNNKFEIHMSSINIVKFIADNNIHRDVIAVTIRMCTAKKLFEKEIYALSNNLQNTIDFVDSNEPEEKETIKDVAVIVTVTASEEDIQQVNKDLVKSNNDSNSNNIPENTNINSEENQNVNDNKIDMTNEKTPQEKSIQEVSQSDIQLPQTLPLKDLTYNNNSLNVLSLPTSNKKSADYINVEVLMKMEQMNKDFLRLAKEKDSLMQNLENEKENTRRLEYQIKELNNSYQVANNNLQIVIEDNDNIRKENEKLINEKLFFQQDITLYKSQSQDLKQLLEDYEESTHEFENNTSGTTTTKTVGRRRLSHEKREIKDKYEGIIMESKAKINTLEIKNTELKLELDKIKDILIQLNQTNEELESQNNHLNKKYICLSQEKERLGGSSNSILCNQNLIFNQGLSQNHINSQNSGERDKSSGASSGLVSPSLKKERSNSETISNNTSGLLENNQSLLTDRLVQIEEKQKDKERIQILDDEVKFLKDQIQKLTITNETYVK